MEFETRARAARPPTDRPSRAAAPLRTPPGRPAPKREDQLAATLDHAAVGIAEVDADGRLMRVNAHFCRLMGYSTQELQGRGMFGESHPDEVAPDREQYRRQRA